MTTESLLLPTPPATRYEPAPREFSAHTAFSRNLGLVSRTEQDRLARACVAIPGVGGVGGSHALTLARQGVGRFHLADFDTFSLANINRQAGAFVSTLGWPKVEVLRDLVLDINPDAEVTIWKGPVDETNVDAFLDGVDVVLDGIDFFAIEARRLVFRKARARGKWALTAGPLGFGAAFLAFAPDAGMAFDDYFDFGACSSTGEKIVAFAVGLAPAGLHARYMDLREVDFREMRGPSAALACQLCSSIVSLETISILLGWPTPDAAPAFTHLDLKTHRYVRGTAWFGNRGPFQRLKRALLKRQLSHLGVDVSALDVARG
jgi:molybdopterin/thiamine biosynthesis adenylyltransferase